MWALDIQTRDGHRLHTISVRDLPWEDARRIMEAFKNRPGLNQMTVWQQVE